ncbi:hypothetical protein [Tardiphaga sp.]|jgi:hypothetical protein|uniref:hypothetical protein n=1 Tax=Tardiphaga sp. TaxID=1926292 RepID=UPI0037D9E10A
MTGGYFAPPAFAALASAIAVLQADESLSELSARHLAIRPPAGHGVLAELPIVGAARVACFFGFCLRDREERGQRHGEAGGSAGDDGNA